MYTEFYKLKEIPFDLTPSPRFVYLGDGHKEALSHLTYGVTESKGIILLTGEIGTGKTTMVKKLLSNLDTIVQYVYISNPLLSPGDFMEYLAFSAFKRRVHFKTPEDFLSEFERFLRQCREKKQVFILIIDEAQNLSYEILEHIRVLSDMETNGEKLIGIFLVGQSELNEKLNDPRCRAIQQRIKSRYQIPSLDLQGTRDYLATRLRVAGAKNGNSIFSRDAVKVIYEYSAGYPRMINSVADNVLLLGYSRGKRKITPYLVRQCYEDMNLNGALLANTRKEVTPSHVKIKKRVRDGRRWKWAAVLLLVLALGAVGITESTRNLLLNLPRSEEVRRQVPPDMAEREPAVVRKKIKRESEDLAYTYVAKQQPAFDVQPYQEAFEGTPISKTEEAKEPSPQAESHDEKLLSSILVEEIHICRQVIDRKPLDVGNSFKAGVEKLYCFTKIVLRKNPPTEITHVWYFGQSERARIILPVKSYSWRTYSSKKILKKEVGDWHVDVLGPEGEVLSTIRFSMTYE